MFVLGYILKKETLIDIYYKLYHGLSKLFFLPESQFIYNVNGINLTTMHSVREALATTSTSPEAADLYFQDASACLLNRIVAHQARGCGIEHVT
jgi:hypothetical protein